MEDKERFLNICKNHIKRDGIDKLLNWLEKSDFYKAPASSRFHLSCPGGLLKHSLNVFDRLEQLYSGVKIPNIGSLSDGYSETIAIVSLFHDLCKVNFYKSGTRNVKNEETGQWEKVPSYEVEEKFSCGEHGAKSAYLVSQFMKLTPEEFTCISAHMGMYDRYPGDYSLNKAYEQFPLALLLHTADNLACVVDEKE